jgi:hypothetical protein
LSLLCVMVTFWWVSALASHVDCAVSSPMHTDQLHLLVAKADFGFWILGLAPSPNRKLLSRSYVNFCLKKIYCIPAFPW